MAKRKADRPLQKVTLNLYQGDFEKLAEMYPKLGSSIVVRELVSAHIRKVEERALQKLPPPPEVELV